MEWSTWKVLKTHCGFDVREIAIRLFTSEANLYKRLGHSTLLGATNPAASVLYPNIVRLRIGCGRAVTPSSNVLWPVVISNKIYCPHPSSVARDCGSEGTNTRIHLPTRPMRLM